MLDFMGSIDIILWNYNSVDVKGTLTNISQSLTLCTSYLTADYLFRGNLKEAYVVRESINKIIPILSKI